MPFNRKQQTANIIPDPFTANTPAIQKKKNISPRQNQY